MRSVVYEAPGVVSVHQHAVPDIGPTDVLIRVDACGVCGSDLSSFAHGHYIDPGQVMGHEIAGTVAATGEDFVGVRVGERVAVRPMRSCGECPYCRDGDTHLCDNTRGPSLGYGTPGGFAEYVVIQDAVSGDDVIGVPSAVDPYDLLWAEPLAVALHALDRLQRPVTELLVIGAGAVGLTIIAAATSLGMSVTVVEPLPERRRAAEGFGARAFEPGPLDVEGLFEAAIDASGVPAAVEANLPFLTVDAPIVLVGLGDREVAFPAEGREIRGAFAYRQPDFVRAVELIVGGTVRLGECVSQRWALEDAALALRGPAGGLTVIKAALAP